MQTVFEETENPDFIVATAAYRALGHMAVDDSLPVLLNKFASLTNKDLYSTAVESTRDAIVATDDSTKRSLAVKSGLAHCQDVEIRCALLELLPLCGNAEALQILKGAVVDPNSSVKDTAIRALADWPDSSAWDALYAILQTPDIKVHRSLAFRALVRLAREGNALPEDSTLERYRLLLQSARHDDELKLILSAIGDLAKPFALDLALPLLGNTNVHAEAEVAVRKIAEAVRNSAPRAAAQALSQLHSK